MSPHREGANAMSVTIEILRCPTHGYMCVAINELRITDKKCCGTWKSVRKWTTTRESLTTNLTRAGVLP